MKDQEILKKAIEYYGTNNQVDKIIEECNELIEALEKYKSEYSDDVLRNNELIFNVCDETADVGIMIQQARIIFDNDLIQKRREFKIHRLKKRMLK